MSEYFPDGAPAELGQATLEDARKPSVEVLVQAANEVTYTFLFGYDVSIAKNYLSREELQALERIVTMYLDYAEYQAGRHIPMTMQDWSQRLNRFLEFNEHEILHDTGRVTHEIAKAFAESEFEKYRIVQDRMFESDFDHFLALEEQAERKND